jgi:hypothetical protein
MVVHDLYVIRISIMPDKANPPPIIDSDAVLTLTVSVQLFQAIPWRYPQVA